MRASPESPEFEESAEVRELLARRAERLKARSDRGQEETTVWVAEFPLGEERFALPLEALRAALPLRMVTAVPLILYANAAKLLRLSTIGLMQYIAPTMIFFTAVFIFREPFSTERLVAFGFIWAALALYTWSLLSGRGPAPEATSSR